MNKKSKILNIILIILNCISTYCLASNSWVNRMPSFPETNYSFFRNLHNLFLGQGFPTLIIAGITVLISYIANRMFIKDEIKFIKYIILFCIMFGLNLFIYRIGIGIVV